MSALEDRLRPLVQAELSVLVDVLHRPELLFPENTDLAQFFTFYLSTILSVLLRLSILSIAHAKIPSLS